MKDKTYDIFWQDTHKLAEEKGILLRAMFELTYRCNFFCRHCYVPFSYRKIYAKELSAKEVFVILDELRDMGCFYLGFSGGEPFVRKDIMDILGYAKKLGFQIVIYTNGSLINKQTAKELADIMPNKIDITIPAMSQESFDVITGTSGFRDRVFKAVDLLQKNGIQLGFKTCVLQENESEIGEIQNFAYYLNATYRIDNQLSPRLDGSKEPFKYRARYRYAQHRNQEETAAKEIIEGYTTDKKICYNQLALSGELFFCGAGRSQAAITPQGELKICLQIDYPKYKISDLSLKGAWERLKDLVSSIKPAKNYLCDKCPLSPYCQWCPARSWLEYKNFTSCDPESRLWAEYKRDNYLAKKGALKQAPSST